MYAHHIFTIDHDDQNDTADDQLCVILIIVVNGDTGEHTWLMVTMVRIIS